MAKRAWQWEQRYSDLDYSRAGDESAKEEHNRQKRGGPEEQLKLTHNAPRDLGTSPASRREHRHEAPPSKGDIGKASSCVPL
ncbi:MAG: hypothetical protein RLZZ303_170 [Candidatus Hydrogenedentota bacterium]|jgi:hypothetical protein